ncbi:MAG: type II toxin-antitoxin system HicA family toxin [Verrucomicrobia bacterium]|nr:type II toxin-antitoxin system HicA family toxin [Verrucomicrobiota bacterium]
MAKRDKLKAKLLSGDQDNNFDFDELCTLLLQLGFTERQGKGSHRIFFREGVDDIINVQPAGKKAKPYQVRQVRQIISAHNL